VGLDHVVFNNQEYGRKIAELAGIQLNRDYDVSIARERNGKFLGGVLFTNYTTEAIMIHSGAEDPHWINKDMLYVTFDYPFNQLGVKRIFGMVPEDNIHALDFNAKVGFQTKARIEGFYKGGLTAVVMCLEKADCRFLGVRPRGIRSNMS
jgi:RimJ/RimL family protein N-acetyltransferase